jgi:long-chain fatty acid transport protein
MKKRGFACCFGVFSLFILPALALGSGYGLNELGTKALGMGGAFVAQADDPTAVYFNPAGIVQLEGTQVSVGVNTVTPSVTFESNGTSGIAGTFAGQKTDTKDKTFFIPNAYITHKFSDKISFGFATFSNFGLETDWPDDWEGRYVLGGKKARIQTVSLNPVLAYRPHERVSFGFGLVAQYYEIEAKWDQFVFVSGLIPPTDIATKLDGDDWGWGWNVGLLVWITDNLRFGATFRSQVTHNINNGSAKFSPNIAAVGIQNTGAKTSIDTPPVAYLGLAYTYQRLTLEFDAQWTKWSTFEKLKVTFDEPVGGQPFLQDSFDWKDTWAYRFGAQYRVFDWLDLRAGFIYDEQTVPDDTLSVVLPSGDRKIYTFGASGHYKRLSVDFAYNYLDDETRRWNNSKGDSIGSGALAGGTRVTGTFKDQDAHIFGLNLTYRF